MKKLIIALLVGSALHVHAQEATKKQESFPRFRMALNGGFSQLLGKIANQVPAEDRNYVSELKSGYHYGADATYFVKEWGVGLKFSQFKSNNSGMNTYQGQRVPVEDNITHTYIGPSFSGRHVTVNQRHAFVFALSLGYLGYVDKASANRVPEKITGGTLGSALDAGYDLNLTKNIAIGAQLSLVGGVLKKVTRTQGGITYVQKFEDNQKESLGRLDVSFGARFNF